MTFDIIGAGIGGLTTAIALKQKGFNFHIYEQSEKIKFVGAGIILANNAMQVFDQLGLKKVIEENGQPISALNITNGKLKVLSTINLTHFEKKHPIKNIAIHRGTLQELLIEHLGHHTIELNHKLNTIKQSDHGQVLQFENGKNIESQQIIGSDGLNSIVRQQLFPNNKIRNAKQVCWRGITHYSLPLKFRHELNEVWAKNARFGFVQIAENTVYWYLLKTFKTHRGEHKLDGLSAAFKNDAPLLMALIDSTEKSKIHEAEISDLKPTKTWYNQNACLIGDAAHAATPNMGQGACQAIEDAFTLTACLNKFAPYEAYKTYQNLRIKKAHSVVNDSWKIGKIAHLSNPFLTTLRNQMMRMTPSKIGQNKTEQLFKLSEA